MWWHNVTREATQQEQQAKLADDMERGATIVYDEHPGIAAMMQVAAMVIRESQPPESIVTPRKEKRGSY